ncbi:sensor domain-containing diguanylate cyclase [Aliidiomarina celeris]|uniref:sensor domain-containing diguanylate cyclase n=1 Tax=Aliidiomarina celeris TaxID=2249428 RepID=UPI000DEA709C|nr:diguanylate cyclase [Aliidiomarina celeris]
MKILISRIKSLAVTAIIVRSLAIFLLLSVAFTVTIINEVRYFVQKSHDLAYQKFEQSVESTARLADAIFEAVIDRPDVAGLFAQAHEASEEKQLSVRADLYNALLPLYQSLLSSDIQQLHFHTSTNHSFLRFHRPNLFGDDLTPVRPSIVYVNKHLKPFHGFEEGRIFNGFRHVYPIVHNSVHVGSVEISNSLGSFKKAFENSGTEFVDFVLFKQVVEDKVFESEQSNYISYPLSSELLIQSSLNIPPQGAGPFNVEVKDALLERMQNRRSVQNAIQANADYFGITWLNGALYSMKLNILENGSRQEPVGYVVSFSTFDYIAESARGHLNQFVLFFLVSILFAWILYRQRSLLKEMKRYARYDSLTGFMNRRYFLEVITAKLTENVAREGVANREGRKRDWVPSRYSLIMFDIDHFKAVNDQYGHDIGDLALKYLATLVADLQKSNDGRKRWFARWGGEEFMGFLRADCDQAYDFAETMRKMIEEKTDLHPDLPRFTCSFGVVEITDRKNLQGELKRVDQALYEAKATGRNKVVRG